MSHHIHRLTITCSLVIMLISGTSCAISTPASQDNLSESTQSMRADESGSSDQEQSSEFDRLRKRGIQYDNTIDLYTLEPGEVCVINVNEAEVQKLDIFAHSHGYTKKKRRILNNLGFIMSILHVPTGQTVEQGIATLRQQFPTQIIDANHHYTIQGENAGLDPQRYGQRLVGWDTKTMSCTTNTLRIGMIDTAVDRSHPHLQTQVIHTATFLSKTTFHSVGGFPEHLQTCEDYYFTQKVAETGRLLYTSASNYVHLGEDKAFLPMFKKEIWRGQSNLASIKGRSIPLRELPSFFIPFAVTLGVAFILVALLYSNMSLVIMASVLTILPLVVYTGRLKKLTGSSVNTGYCLLFYCLYFPARVFGTLLGIKGALGTPTYR